MTPPDDERRDADDHLRPHDAPAGQPDGPPPPPANPYAPQQGQPHGQQPYPPQPYGQQPYGQPYPGAGYHAPHTGGGEQHPSATTALVLGIVSLAGILFCGGITLLLAPFAWWMGGKAVKEIDADPGRYTGRDQAQGGRVMGIIGTVLLALGLLALVLAVVVFAVAVPTGTFEGSVSATAGVLR